MSNIIHFKPKAQLDATANVDEFIRLCRDELTVFGAELDWACQAWPKVCNFTKIGTRTGKIKESNLLAKEIIPFAKAYVRYGQGLNPTHVKYEIKAIRCIEPALIKVKGVADITLTDMVVLDEAINVARENLRGTAYHAGNALEKLVVFLNDKMLVTTPFTWKNPLRTPGNSHKTNAKAKAARDRKMPPEHVLEYMAEIFSNDPENPRDRYASSMFALMMCAPGRVSEFHDLPVECIHREKDSQGVERVGLRFYAGKGFGPSIKWIPTPMVSVALEAVRRLRELSAEGRKLARWLESQPEALYRHEKCPNVPQDQALSPEQVCDALGLSYVKGKHSSVAFHPELKFTKWMNAKGLKRDEISLRVINDYCRDQLPKGWPWKNKQRGIKWVDSLVTMRRNEFNAQKAPLPFTLWAPDQSALHSTLSTSSGWHKNLSIWERHGYKNPDGSPISITSHQLRHYLNTLANRGELGQLEIAKWSGRVNVSQNRVYNHMTDDEMVEKVRGTPALAKMIGPLKKIKVNEPVTLKDLEEVGEGIAHVTEFGFCVHDFAMVPCQKHRDCLNCSAQVCVKGDEEKLKRLKKMRTAITGELEKAIQAARDEFYGSDRWIEHQTRTLERANQLIEILESPDVEEGAVVRLHNDQEFSPLKRELAARNTKKRLSTEGPSMDEIRALLGGTHG